MSTDQHDRYSWHRRLLKMLKIFVLLSLAACALAASTPLPRLDGRIVGGSATTIANYPYQISLQYSGSHICGGSIISAQYILTAAHCMVYTTSGYSVRVGSTYRGSGGTVYGVASKTQHSSYNSRTYDYDIAVIRLSSNIALGTNAKVVALPAQGESVSTGASAVVTGWGTTSEGGSAASTLQQVSVPVVSNSQCNGYYGSGSITDRMICAGYTAGGRDACQGDSGGPLVSGGKQIGVVSWGYGCARPNYPGVYARVANLRNWIKSNSGV